MYYMKIRSKINHLEEDYWLPLRKPDSSIIYFNSQKQLTVSAACMNLFQEDYLVCEDKSKKDIDLQHFNQLHGSVKQYITDTQLVNDIFNKEKNND